MNISDFDKFEQLGESQTAVIWKAHQISLDRDIVIKIWKKKFPPNTPETVEFTNEAKASAGLKHPNIIQIFDTAEEDGIYYFVMEYVTGKTAVQMIEKEPLQWKKTAQTGLAIAEAMNHAWTKAKLVHRNIKPVNIMFDADGTIKLADLGLTRHVDIANLAQQQKAGKIEALLNYMSPEQASGLGPLDCRSDMYNLGATMYHLVTGQIPFEKCPPERVSEMHTSGHLPNPHDIIPAIPPGFSQLIAMLMMKSPNNRYSSWSKVITELKKVIGGRVSFFNPAKRNDSTINPPQHNISARPAKKISVMKKINQRRHTPVVNNAPTPKWITASAWSILSLWWIYLIFSICAMPPKITLPKPMQPVIAKPMAGASPVKPAENQITPVGTAPATTYAAEERIFLDSLKSKLVDYIIGDNLSEAITGITQERSYATSPDILKELDSLEELIKAISGKNQLLKTVLEKKTGQEIVIHIHDADWNVIIRSIENDFMKIDVKSRIGGEVKLRPGVLAFDQLSSAEFIRLLGPADTTAKCAIVFALSFKAKDYQTALKAAEKSGPLADLLKARIANETAIKLHAK